MGQFIERLLELQSRYISTRRLADDDEEEGFSDEEMVSQFLAGLDKQLYGNFIEVHEQNDDAAQHTWAVTTRKAMEFAERNNLDNGNHIEGEGRALAAFPRMDGAGRGRGGRGRGNRGGRAGGRGSFNRMQRNNNNVHYQQPFQNLDNRNNNQVRQYHPQDVRYNQNQQQPQQQNRAHTNNIYHGRQYNGYGYQQNQRQYAGGAATTQPNGRPIPIAYTHYCNYHKGNFSHNTAQCNVTNQRRGQGNMVQGNIQGNMAQQNYVNNNQNMGNINDGINQGYEFMMRVNNKVNNNGYTAGISNIINHSRRYAKIYEENSSDNENDDYLINKDTNVQTVTNNSEINTAMTYNSNNQWTATYNYTYSTIGQESGFIMNENQEFINFLEANSNIEEIYIDSGASGFYIKNKEILENIYESSEIKECTMGDGSILKSSCCGSIGIFKEVYYVPNLQYNLMSTNIY